VELSADEMAEALSEICDKLSDRVDSSEEERPSELLDSML